MAHWQMFGSRGFISCSVEVKNTFEHDGQLQGMVQNGGADLMLARSGRPMNPVRRTFCFICTRLMCCLSRGARSEGIKVGLMSTRLTRRRRISVDDADGYTVSYRMPTESKRVFKF